jgi:hypothetical protein
MRELTGLRRLIQECLAHNAQFVVTGESGLEQGKLSTERESSIGITAPVGGAGRVGESVAEERAARQKRLNRGDKVASSARLADKSLSARLANLADEPGRFMHGKYEESGGKMVAGDFVRNVEPAHPRHGDIQDGDIGFERLYGLRSLVSSGCVAADFPFGTCAVNHGVHTLADNFVVVGYQNSGWHLSYISGPYAAFLLRLDFS